MESIIDTITEITHPLNNDVEVEVEKKCIRKSHPQYVLKTKVEWLKSERCSQSFKDLELSKDEYVYIKCNKHGDIKYRKSGNYYIFEYKSYDENNPCLTFEYYDQNMNKVFKNKKAFDTLDQAIKQSEKVNSIERFISRLSPYKCKMCKKWHLGRSK